MKTGVVLSILVASSVSSASAQKLFGHVEHSDHLAPVENATLGKVFTEALAETLLLKAKPSKSIVPNWLAGTWQRDRSSETIRIALPSNARLKPGGVSVAKVTDKFGSFVDEDGLICQIYDPSKAEGQVDRGAQVDHHLVSFYQLVETGPKSVVVEVVATHLVVNKKSGKITSVYQDEEINTYTSLTDSQLRTDSSVKIFDAHGKPIYLTKSVSMEERIAPFQSAVK